MSQVWQVSVIALAVTTCFLAVIVLGMLRRVVNALDHVQDAVSAGLTAASAGAPGHEWTHAVGQVHELLNLPELARSETHVITFLEAGCDSCRGLARDVLAQERRARRSGQTLVFVLDSRDGLFRDLAERYPSVVDTTGDIALAWHAANTKPVAFLVRADGFVLASTTPNTLQHLLSMKDKLEASLPRHQLSGDPINN